MTFNKVYRAINTLISVSVLIRKISFVKAMLIYRFLRNSSPSYFWFSLISVAHNFSNQLPSDLIFLKP